MHLCFGLDQIFDLSFKKATLTNTFIDTWVTLLHFAAEMIFSGANIDHHIAFFSA